MADCTAIKTKLDEAQAAYDRLVSGQSIRVIVDSDGSRIEYNAANRQALYAYIQDLTAQYATCLGQPVAVALKPIQFVF